LSTFTPPLQLNRYFCRSPLNKVLIESDSTILTF
jgi:hypothetical protein